MPRFFGNGGKPGRKEAMSHPYPAIRRLAFAFAAATLALAASAPSPALAQPYMVSVGNAFGEKNSKTTATPAYVDWSKSGNAFQYGWAEVSGGHARGLAVTDHFVGFFDSSTTSVARFSLDDVIITPPPGSTATSVSTSLRMTLSGGYSLSGGSAQVALSGWVTFPNQFSGLATIDSSGQTSTGILSGYPNNGTIGVVTPSGSVPVNTPLSVAVVLTTKAGGSGPGTSGQSQYELGLGAPSLGFPEVFDLPAGYTVNSTQAGIVDNQWSPLPAIQLDVDKSTVPPGSDVALTTWNGGPSDPCALFVTQFGGSPTFVFTGVVSTFDANGHWSVGPIPNQASLAGLSIGVQTAAPGPFGSVQLSDEEVIQFQ